MKLERFIDLKTVNERVLFLLKTVPATRENDNQLVATYILNEIGNEDVANMSSLDLLAKIANSRLTPFATIIRARQDIQKNNEELKGSVFGKRKKAVNPPLFKVNIREK
jgi:hypothetical protein